METFLIERRGEKLRSENYRRRKAADAAMFDVFAFAPATARQVMSNSKDSKTGSGRRNENNLSAANSSSNHEGFVSRQLPAALDRYLTALPAMSLVPVAPFLSAQPRCCGLHIAHDECFGARYRRCVNFDFIEARLFS